jgi:hypothetical protein
MGTVPQKLNWVQLRAECSLEKVFANLHLEVNEDVRIANELLPNSPRRPPFEVIPNDKADAFTVRREGTIRPTVVFRLELGCIMVDSQTNPAGWKFYLGLNDEGRCVLRENGIEYEQWQIRRMTLEALLFEPSH